MRLFVDPAAINNPRIIIPDELPDIMKQYTKAAIRTQPRDVLRWSVAYFMAVTNGACLPVKERIELLPKETSWITLGFLRILHRQLGNKKTISIGDLQTNWEGLCLNKDKFKDAISEGKFNGNVEWRSFLAIVCCLASENIVKSVILFCEVITEEPEGCPARVAHYSLSQAYLTMAKRFGVTDQSVIDSFLQHLADCAEVQSDKVHPGNILSSACPNLS